MLILKHLPVASFSENIAYINRNCSAYKADDINALVKIEIHGGVRTIYAFLQIVDDDTVVAPNQLALNNEAFEQINLPEGAKVSISVSPTPPSINSIARKIAGNILTSGEYSAIVNDIVSKRYSNLDIASFLVASGSFMSAPEVLSLTEAMVGDKLIHWDNENIVVDYEVGDTIKVVAGAWADTIGVVQSINMQKQSLTINVELFGRETPVEISFAEVVKM